MKRSELINQYDQAVKAYETAKQHVTGHTVEPNAALLIARTRVDQAVIALYHYDRTHGISRIDTMHAVVA